jgi:phage head maturation protease
VIPLAKSQAALEALERLTEAGRINAELIRRKQLERKNEAIEFEGQTFLQIDGLYTGKASAGGALVEGLLIEGVAAAWTKDREDEIFMPGAFDQALAKARESHLPLVYSHSEPLFNDIYGRGKHGKLQLGVIKDLWKDPKEGLKLRAFIPRPAAGHPILEDIYQKIARGEMRGLSVGGKMRSMGGKIFDTDLAEVSVAPGGINGQALITKVTPEDVAV